MARQEYVYEPVVRSEREILLELAEVCDEYTSKSHWDRHKFSIKRKQELIKLEKRMKDLLNEHRESRG